MRKINKNHILDNIRKQIIKANYSPVRNISGVKLIELKDNISEDGELSEIIKLNGKGTLVQFPDFKLLQMNRVNQNPNTVKAWHLHYHQDEIWYVPPSDHLLIGLWDIRKDSPTANLQQKIVLGSNKSAMLYIPRGVAHGSANFQLRPSELYSMVNRLFNPDRPDEMRLPWDIIGKEFWQPLKD